MPAAQDTAVVPRPSSYPTRHSVLESGAASAALTGLPRLTLAIGSLETEGIPTMGFVNTSDGVEILCQDWGPKDTQPIVFHHCRPLSSDCRDPHMLFIDPRGFRVVAIDRRGHGRSAQVAGRVDKAVLVAAIPPRMLQTETNPEGTPLAVFDSFRADLAASRAQFLQDVPAGPFFGCNRECATEHQGMILSKWRQGMMSSAKAHCAGMKELSETDETEDLRAISVLTLIMHGGDEQIVPIAPSADKALKLLQNDTLKVDPGLSHGMLSVNADLLNEDLLAFIKV